MDMKLTGDFVTTKYVVDLDADPFLLDDWEVVEHIKGGQFEFDSTKVALYLDEAQKRRRGRISSNELRERLKVYPVYNANLLEFYLEHPNFIPEEWKDHQGICFWGTIYANSDGGLCVCLLAWEGDEWAWECASISSLGHFSFPAVVSASS